MSTSERLPLLANTRVELIQVGAVKSLVVESRGEQCHSTDRDMIVDDKQTRWYKRVFVPALQHS